MKLSEFELQDVASTFKQESLENLKAIQGLMNKEINNRMATVDCYPTPVSLGYCATIPVAAQEKACNKMSTANSMSIVTAYPQETIEERRISFLVGQLSEAKHRKNTELQRHHGLLDDERPRSPKELVERIEKGLYVIPEQFAGDDVYGYNITDYFEWRNPKVKKDKEGYAKSKKEMEADFRETNRIIILKDEEKGLAALEKFEKAKFH